MQTMLPSDLSKVECSLQVGQVGGVKGNNNVENKLLWLTGGTNPADLGTRVTATPLSFLLALNSKTAWYG
jgi:hypothetical protein